MREIPSVVGARYLTPPVLRGYGRYGPNGPYRPHLRAATEQLPNCYRAVIELLLGVQLDDQLLLHLGVDHLALGHAVHEDPQVTGVGLQPRRHRLVAGLALGHRERGQVTGPLADLDDVVHGHAGRRDVGLAAVDGDVSVPDQLTGVVAGLGEAGPVHHVVEAGLKDAQKVLTGLAGLLVGFLVVVHELLFEDTVDTRALLLLTQLKQVLAVLGAPASVLTRGVRTDLDRALRALALRSLEEELLLLPTATLAVGPGITRHCLVLLFRLVRLGGASAGGSRCAGSG